jgi:cob(I)alamin adenosyltransferase
VAGDLDELNSIIGVAAEHCEAAGSSLVPALRDVQCCLFDLGAFVATPRDSSAEAKVRASERMRRMHCLCVCYSDARNSAVRKW